MVRLVDAWLIPVRAFGRHMRMLLLSDDLDIATFSCQNRLANIIARKWLKRGFEQVLVIRK
jgi:hypothetical protein